MDPRRTHFQQSQQVQPSPQAPDGNNSNDVCQRGKGCGANWNQGQGQQRNLGYAGQRACGTGAQRQGNQSGRQQQYDEQFCWMNCPDHHGKGGSTRGSQNDQDIGQWTPPPPPRLPNFGNPNAPNFNNPNYNTRSQNQLQTGPPFRPYPTGPY